MNNQPNVNRIKELTQKIIAVPTLPTVISTLLELIDNPKTSASALAKHISYDQALTGRVLKMANSAYYGFSREISTVNSAIVVMGFNAVREMGLSLSVFDIFKNVSSMEHFDVIQFWRHSLGCATAAKMMTKYCKSPMVSQAFVAGLLHDIGKIVINHYMPQEFCAIVDLVFQKQVPLEDAELEVLGVTHAEIGGWLGQQWKLPVMICECIEYHHHPWDAPCNSVTASVIACANSFCHYLSIGNSLRLGVPQLDERVWHILQTRNSAFENSFFESIKDEYLVELLKTEKYINRE